MYSNSSSYLSGANSARPGPPQYGLSSFSSASQQQQQNGFAPQPTGFQGSGLQQQYTGYPAQGQQQPLQTPQHQPQFTGYPSQNQPSQQHQLQTGQPSQQQVIPQKTGQTSSQIAASFSVPVQSTSAPPLPGSVLGAKIPKIRLSFLTATDQAKFEQLFKSAVGDGQALDGALQCRVLWDGAYCM